MSFTSYGCHYSHGSHSHGIDICRDKTGLQRGSACAQVNSWGGYLLGLSKGGSADRKIPSLSVSPLDSYACFVTVTNPLPLSQRVLSVLHRWRAAGCPFPCPSWKWGWLLWSKACSGRARSPLPLMLVCSLEPNQPFGWDALSCGWKLHQKFTAEDSWATRQQPASAWQGAFPLLSWASPR